MRLRYKKLRLERLRDSSCRLCPLYKSTTRVCILGKGNLKAPVFLVGEAPGEAEEKFGKPFCGRAGKLLDKLIVPAGLRDLVYISNTCHCRPPHNRKPTDEEVDICWPYTAGEIKIIQPWVVVLLGRVAMDAMGLDKSMRGDYYYDEKLRAWILSTWHPSYCLRRGKKPTQELLEVLKKAKELSVVPF
jgi:uracil-DNA glycosylase family 4